MPEVVQGIGVSAGIGVGRVHLLHAEPLPVVPKPVPPERIDEEIERFHTARARAAAELDVLKSQVLEALGERHAGIFEAQKLVLDDPSLVAETVQRIRVGRVSARWALKEVVSEFLRKFERVEDDYIRERGGELTDVQHRLQRLLRGQPGGHPPLPEGPVVIVAQTVDPSDAVLLAGSQVMGLATDAGGRTSHTAILAQALSLPAVVGLHDLSRRARPGDLAIVDGDGGEVMLSPTEEETARAERRREAVLEIETRHASARDLPAETLDGVSVVIRANIEFPSEIERALDFGAQGIGLYRSEFLFLSRSPSLPDEQAHFETYVEIARKVAPHPLVIRTLDLGGEKYSQEVLARKEPNPVLGLRGVRLSLARPEIFVPQLRGVLRAATAEPNVRVMLPVVTTVEEVRAVRRLIARETEDLRSAGVQVRDGIPLGIMIEVPAAALAADLLATEADFFSIGTNDLIQYALAVDRGNESLDHLCQPFHAGVLRLVQLTVDAARSGGVDVAICGEMAADPQAVGKLIGLGLREFSVHPRAVGRIREAIRGLNAAEEERLVRDRLASPQGQGVPRDG